MYGIDDRDTPELQKLLKFFVPANEKLDPPLIADAEEGKTAF